MTRWLKLPNLNTISAGPKSQGKLDCPCVLMEKRPQKKGTEYKLELMWIKSNLTAAA